MSLKTKYLLKIHLLAAVSFLSLGGLVVSALGADISIPSPQELATWPAQVLLAATTIASIWFAYKTWSRSFDLQKEVAHEISEMRQLLASRPCVMEGDKD